MQRQSHSGLLTGIELSVFEGVSPLTLWPCQLGAGFGKSLPGSIISAIQEISVIQGRLNLDRSIQSGRCRHRIALT